MLDRAVVTGLGVCKVIWLPQKLRGCANELNAREQNALFSTSLIKNGTVATETRETGAMNEFAGHVPVVRGMHNADCTTLLYCTGWPKQVSHYQESSLNRIKNRVF